MTVGTDWKLDSPDTDSREAAVANAAHERLEHEKHKQKDKTKRGNLKIGN